VEVESTKARRACDDYLADGPDRSLVKLAEKYGKSTVYVRQLERWSALYGWQERAMAHDERRRAWERAAHEVAYLAEQQARADERRRAREQRLAHRFAVASAQRAVVLKRLNRLLINEKQLDDLTVKDIIALTEHINMVERVEDAAGADASPSDDDDADRQAGRVDPHEQSDAELRAIIDRAAGA